MEFTTQGKMLFVVEDEPADLKATIGHLEQHGFRVTVARDGQEALARIRVARPDLAILGTLLPGTNGLEICRCLKSDTRTRNIPVIFIAERADPSECAAMLDAGGADWVRKPLHIAEVVARVRTQLTLLELRRQFEHKNAALQTARNDLDRRVAERTRALQESQRQVRELSAFQQRMREQECARISRELHDELGSYLTAIKIGAERFVAQAADGGDLQFAERAQSISRLTDTAIAAMRRIVSNLRPPMLDDLGLPSAVDWLVEQFRRNTGIECELNFGTEDLAMSPDHETAIYRMVQEALTNVARHAGATRVSVCLYCDDDDWIHVEIVDNGRGPAAARDYPKERFGLQGMRERIAGLGGCFSVRKLAAGGTRVDTIIPAAAPTVARDAT